MRPRVIQSCSHSEILAHSPFIFFPQAQGVSLLFSQYWLKSLNLHISHFAKFLDRLFLISFISKYFLLFNSLEKIGHTDTKDENQVKSYFYENQTLPTLGPRGDWVMNRVVILFSGMEKRAKGNFGKSASCGTVRKRRKVVE